MRETFLFHRPHRSRRAKAAATLPGAASGRSRASLSAALLLSALLLFSSSWNAAAEGAVEAALAAAFDAALKTAPAGVSVRRGALSFDADTSTLEIRGLEAEDVRKAPKTACRADRASVVGLSAPALLSKGRVLARFVLVEGISCGRGAAVRRLAIRDPDFVLGSSVPPSFSTAEADGRALGSLKDVEALLAALVRPDGHGPSSDLPAVGAQSAGPTHATPRPDLGGRP